MKAGERKGVSFGRYPRLTFFITYPRSKFVGHVDSHIIRISSFPERESVHYVLPSHSMPHTLHTTRIMTFRTVILLFGERERA